jgi:hypothetical protein
VKRDQSASAFATILADLIRRIPGANAAALVDAEGETVDYWGKMDPFDLRITAAHLQIELGHVTRLRLGAVRTFMLRCARRSYVVRVLHDDYAIIVVLSRRAGFTASRRAFGACERAICHEAGWTLPGVAAGDTTPPAHTGEAWYAVEVVRDGRGRPTRLRWPTGRSSLPGHDKTRKSRLSRGVPVEVLGSVAGLQPRERGFRVRIASGKEVTLVREAGGFWYADEPLEGAMMHAP